MAEAKYTMAEVAKHNKPDDLWIVIKKKVYDCTKWQHEHPGGALCFKRSSVAGKDCTQGFDLYHDEQQAKTLPNYCIGVVDEGEPKKEEKKEATAKEAKYTMAEVAKHNKPDDLWIVIKKKVYDCTKWQHEHPGGALCFKRSSVPGKDCTQGFDLYHDAQHEKTLPNYCIGVVDEGEPKKEEEAEFGEDTPADYQSPPASPASSKARRFLVVESSSISSNTKKMRFQATDVFSPGPAIAPHFHLAPGGHMTFEFKREGHSRVAHRHYTPINYTPDEFEFIVKRYTEGVGSVVLHDLKEGDEALFLGPKLPSYSLSDRLPSLKRLILIAGGTGVAPIYSIAKTAAEAKKAGLSILIVSSFRDEDDALLGEEVGGLLGQYDSIGHCIFYTRQSSSTTAKKSPPHQRSQVVHGRFSKDPLVSAAKQTACSMDLSNWSLGTDVVCCGPPAFNQRVSDVMAKELKFPSSCFTHI